MSNTTKYLARLKPLDAYFFSGREAFAYSSGDLLEGENLNYYVKSEYFPQQTTILGVMRKQILIEKNLYEEDRKKYGNKENLNKIIELIGNGSFNVSQGESSSNSEGFGKIKEISPIFLYKSGDIFTPAPMDYGLGFEKSNGRCCFNSYKSNELTGNKDIYKNYIPNLKNCNAKDGLNEKIVCFNPYEKLYSYNEVFLPDERIGIDTGVDEDGFYRQRSIKLKSGFEFCFYIEVEKDENKNIFDENYSDTVYIGGEGRPFKLSLEIVKDDILIDKLETGENRIVCISDVLVSEEDFYKIKKSSRFVLGKIKYFKNFVTNYEGTTDTSIKPHLLLERGSVIYYEAENDRKEIEKIINKKHIKIIGYNYITGGVK